MPATTAGGAFGAGVAACGVGGAVCGVEGAVCVCAAEEKTMEARQGRIVRRESRVIGFRTVVPIGNSFERNATVRKSCCQCGGRTGPTRGKKAGWRGAGAPGVRGR